MKKVVGGMESAWLENIQNIRGVPYILHNKKREKTFHRKGAKGAKEMIMPEKNAIDILSHKIIGAAIEVHKGLGPGLLESVYEECLCHELRLADINYERQSELPVVYKNVTLRSLHLCGKILSKINGIIF